MRILICFLLASMLLLFSCQKEVKETSSINGVWESVGSGWVLEIKDSTQYSFYDITAISCLPRRTGAIEELKGFLTLEGDTLLLLTGVLTYKYVRGTGLPELCTQKLSETQKEDPLFNFEIFAETVKEHYAFLELNNINWQALYERQKERLATNPTETELYLILEETLEELKDNHAFLEATEEVYEAVEKLSAPAPESENKEEELPEYGDFQVASMVSEHHLVENMTKDSWLIQWGKMTNNIGFIQIKAMWLYADLAIPQSLIDEIGFVDAYVETFHKMYEGDYIEKEVIGGRKIMDRVMKDLSAMDAIVIDIRFNGGGQDAISHEILSRFTQKNTPIGLQQLRFGNQLSPPLTIYLKGTANAFLKPIYILTSPQTGSAAEAFALATMSMSNAKRIGSATSGALSTALEKTLPNDWVFSISNEINMDNQGKAYENIGVPVDYDLNYPEDRQVFFRSVVNNLERDKQQIMKAIESVKNGRN